MRLLLNSLAKAPAIRLIASLIGAGLLCLDSSALTAVAQENTAANRPARVRKVAREAAVILQPKLRNWLDAREERARKVMGEQLADGRFLLYLRADVSPEKFLRQVSKTQKSTPLTTLPMDLSSAERQRIAATSLTEEQIPLIVGPITLALTFDTDVSDAQIQALRELIASAINLDIAKGDKVSVTKAPLLAGTTRSKLESLNTRVAEGSKDVERLRYESSIAQQKIAQAEAERSQVQSNFLRAQEQLTEAKDRLTTLETELQTERRKVKELEEEMSIYKTPLGEVKKLIKGLELPLTVLPVALLLFIIASIGFFISLKFQGAKTNKLMQAAEIISQALSKAGRSNNASSQATIDSRSNDLARLVATQNEEGNRAGGNAIPQALLAEELTSARKEASEAWRDLKKYPYLTFAELREWLVGGGPQTQRFVSLVSALGPIESMALLQKFSPVDLAAMRRDGFDSNSKMQGFAAVLQLHRSVTAEVLRRPVVFAQLDFPELIAAGDDILIKGLSACSPPSLALCINLLPGSRKAKVLEELTAELQSRLIDGVALLDAMDLPKLEAQLGLLRKEVGTKLDNRSQQSLGAAEDIAGLLRDTSPKTQAALNQALGRHTKLRDKITEKMITIEDVLAVENDTLAELIDELEPEQIAILISGLAPAAQQRVGSVLPPKIVITVQSEMQRLGSRQSSMRRAQAQSSGLQALLIDKLKTLVDEGVVDLRRRRTESAGQTAPNPSRGGRKEAG